MILSRRTFLCAAATLPAIALVSSRVAAQTPQVYAEDGIAIDGSDAVAYFAGNGPVAGSAAHTVNWQGVTWQFATAENRDLFAADPVAYAPQYGGYCAYAVAQGYTASTVPEAWSLVDGKLYLNFSLRIRRTWEKDIAGYIRAADANWPTLLLG